MYGVRIIELELHLTFLIKDTSLSQSKETRSRGKWVGTENGGSWRDKCIERCICLCISPL